MGHNKVWPSLCSGRANQAPRSLPMPGRQACSRSSAAGRRQLAERLPLQRRGVQTPGYVFWEERAGRGQRAGRGCRAGGVHLVANNPPGESVLPPNVSASAEARPSRGRRATTTVALVTLLSAAALLTTSWTASSLLPAQSYRCFAHRCQHSRPPGLIGLCRVCTGVAPQLMLQRPRRRCQPSWWPSPSCSDSWRGPT